MTKYHSEQPAVRVVSSKIICDNHKFNVRFEHIIDNEGLEVPNYLVVEPKIYTADQVSGVAILPIFDNKIGLIRIYRPAVSRYFWEIPHGFIEPSESSETSAIRELLEEAGAAPKEIISLGYITPDAGLLRARVQLFLAKNCKLVSAQENELGLSGFKLVDINEFEAMIQRSEIEDSFTLSAWCRYLLFNNQKASLQHVE